jgi:hypothetical protein
MDYALEQNVKPFKFPSPIHADAGNLRVTVSIFCVVVIIAAIASCYLLEARFVWRLIIESSK